MLLFYAIAELFHLSSTRMTMGVTTSVFFVVYGAALIGFAWSVWRLNSWARSPLVGAQLIQLGVAYSFWGGGTTVVAVVLGLAALVVLAGVFHPASLEALADEV